MIIDATNFQALELHLEEGDLGEIYIWRMLTVIGGVYLFFNVERLLQFACCCRKVTLEGIPDSKVHGANMGPNWVLSAPDGPHVGLMNLAIRDEATMT